jgi:hypothetical protein
MRELLVSAVMLVGSLGLWAAAGVHREAPLVGASRLPDSLGSLEFKVARNPSDRASLLRLADLYLDRDAPGLAIAAIQRAPSNVRDDPEVAHALGRAWLHEGHASNALAAQQSVLSACSDAPCAPWLVASALRHERFLSALLRRGIEDYRQDPDGTVAAYQTLSESTVAMFEVASMQRP